MDRKKVSAWLVGCEPGSLLGYADYGDYVAVVAPKGQKFIFDLAQLTRGEKAMLLEVKIDDVVPKRSKTIKGKLQ